MLVLRRRINQTIVIGHNELIKIKVLGVHKKRKRSYTTLGIEAPRCVSIHRKEIHDLMKKRSKK